MDLAGAPHARARAGQSAWRKLETFRSKQSHLHVEIHALEVNENPRVGCEAVDFVNGKRRVAVRTFETRVVRRADDLLEAEVPVERCGSLDIYRRNGDSDSGSCSYLSGPTQTRNELLPVPSPPAMSPFQARAVGAASRTTLLGMLRKLPTSAATANKRPIPLMPTTHSLGTPEGLALHAHESPEKASIGHSTSQSPRGYQIRSPGCDALVVYHAPNRRAPPRIRSSSDAGHMARSSS